MKFLMAKMLYLRCINNLFEHSAHLCLGLVTELGDLKTTGEGVMFI